MPKLVNPFFFEYRLECTFPGCGGVRLIEQSESAGWAKGSIIPYDASHPDVARCHRCQRYMMKVVNEPAPPAPVEPVGWTKVPTK
jgi:hypothetical protein